MKRLMTWLWRWGWLPGLGLLVAFGFWVARSVNYFVTFGIYRDSVPHAVKLGDTARREMRHTLRTTRLGLWGPSSAEVRDGLPLRSLDLLVEPEALARLDAELPYSGREYVEARLLNDRGQQTVELRYRGDTIVHWGYRKKSLRIRTSSEEPFEGLSRFNLIVGKYSEQLNNYLSYRLASMLELLTPRVELVKVFLNGAYHGLYTLTEQLGESTLIANGRRSGDIFAGELLLRDAWTGVPNELFMSAWLWEKVGADDDDAREGFAPLNALITAVNQPADETSIARLGELVDLDKFARLSVLEVLAQSHHNDHFHNWRLYWDPVRRRFEPVVWDIVGWEETVRSDGAPPDLHSTYSQLLAQLYLHAGFLETRDRVMRHFFEAGIDRNLLDELERVRESVSGPLAADPNLMPPDDDAVAAAMQDFSAFIQRTMSEVRSSWLEAPEVLGWRRPTSAEEPVLLQIEAVRPVRSLELSFSNPIEPTRVVMGIPRPGGQRTEIDLDGSWRVAGNRVVVTTALVSELERRFQWRTPNPMRNNRRIVRSTSYAVLLEGVDMRGLVRVRGTGEDAARRFDERPELKPAPVMELFQVGR